MKLFSPILISVVCCFLSSCDADNYKVTVKTGNKINSKITGRVYITLCSLDRRSDLIRLHNEGKIEFQRDQTDVFNIQTEVGVGSDIKKIRVTLDCYGSSNSNWPNVPDNYWYLEKVTVEYAGCHPHVFMCQEWLNATKAVAISVVCVVTGSPTDYKVIVKTGDDKDAGTHGKVYITLFGSKGTSCRFPLNHEGISEFQRGQTDTFNIKTKDFGIVSKIRIELDSTAESHSPNWFLEAVSLEDLTHNREQWFPWNQWLTPTLDQKIISVDIPASTNEGKQ